MRKDSFLLIVLVAYPTFAQISSGTSVVINFTKDKIVVAADSRGVKDNAGSPDDSNCKIAAFRHQFVFTSVGKVSYVKAEPVDSIETWRNDVVARDALHNAAKRMIIDDAYMDAAVTYWAKAMTNNWSSLCRIDRGKCETKSGLLIGFGAQVTELTAGIFIGGKGLLRAATIDFDNDMGKFLSPVSYKMSSTLTYCWPCGQGEQVCAAGSHIDVAAQFCSERKLDTKIAVRTALTGADEHTRLAVAIVERTIDTYEKVPREFGGGDVGGDVDSVTITKDGNMTWNSRKKNCPENLD